MRAGVCQILYFDKIPYFAAISEVQNAIRDIYKRKFARALLERVKDFKDCKFPYKDKKDAGRYISINYSHPLWLVKRWIKRFGEEDTIKICESNNSEGKHTLLVNTTLIEALTLKNELLKKGYRINSSKYSRGLYIDRVGGLLELEEYRKGYFEIQSEASIIVSELINVKAGDRILDICAGRGGKTFGVAQSLENKSEIVAVDIDKNKIEGLIKNLGRLKIKNVKPVVSDAVTFFDRNGFDKILVDAPCSGLGSLRQHPDIKWKIDERTIMELARLQLAILESAYKNLKIGGELFYVTCSFEEEETIQVIEKFLSKRNDIKLLDLSSNLSDNLKKDIVKGKFFLSIPGRVQLDGFFMARMKRE